MRPRSRCRLGSELRRTCCAAAALALAWVAAAPLIAADYYRADRFGTPLELLDGDPGSGAGFVLAVDTAEEAQAVGLQARRRLLQGGETVHEWRRTAAGEGSLEQELVAGSMVAERRYDGAGLLREERRFAATGELHRRNVLRYRRSTLHRVETYDAAGALLATDSFDLTAAGRLRRFTRTPVPAANGAGRPGRVEPGVWPGTGDRRAPRSR